MVSGRQPKLIQLQTDDSDEEVDDDEGEVILDFKSTKKPAAEGGQSLVK